MAIIIPGKTICPLCGKPIQEGEEIVAFPAFIPNTLDPLYIFDDKAFHAEHFARHPLADKALARLKEKEEHTGPGHRFCAVCGEAIRTPDEYLTLGHLTDDKNSPLYPYNYLQFHRAHLAQWSELAHVYGLLQDLQQSGTWGGKGLLWLIEQLGAEITQTTQASGAS